ncbi:hypothetical protein ABTM57_20020, partial [Acinetobacter baumannii]
SLPALILLILNAPVAPVRRYTLFFAEGSEIVFAPAVTLIAVPSRKARSPLTSSFDAGAVLPTPTFWALAIDKLVQRIIKKSMNLFI